MKDEIILRVQRMFPNCEKYNKCCVDDRAFWIKYQARLKELKPDKASYDKLRSIKND